MILNKQHLIVSSFLCVFVGFWCLFCEYCFIYYYHVRCLTYVLIVLWCTLLLPSAGCYFIIYGDGRLSWKKIQKTSCNKEPELMNISFAGLLEICPTYLRVYNRSFLRRYSKTRKLATQNTNIITLQSVPYYYNYCTSTSLDKYNIHKQVGEYNFVYL